MIIGGLKANLAATEAYNDIDLGKDQYVNITLREYKKSIGIAIRVMMRD